MGVTSVSIAWCLCCSCSILSPSFQICISLGNLFCARGNWLSTLYLDGWSRCSSFYECHPTGDHKPSLGFPCIYHYRSYFSFSFLLLFTWQPRLCCSSGYFWFHSSCHVVVPVAQERQLQVSISKFSSAVYTSSAMLCIYF